MSHKRGSRHFRRLDSSWIQDMTPVPEPPGLSVEVEAPPISIADLYDKLSEILCALECLSGEPSGEDMPIPDDRPVTDLDRAFNAIQQLDLRLRAVEKRQAHIHQYLKSAFGKAPGRDLSYE